MENKWKVEKVDDLTTWNWYEMQLLDQQQVFRSTRGTTDGIFVAKCAQHITRFVDLWAAFDYLKRTWLFKSIKKGFLIDSDKALIQLIELLYSYTSTALTEVPDDSFELNVGVRQGGPESILLYNL